MSDLTDYMKPAARHTSRAMLLALGMLATAGWLAALAYAEHESAIALATKEQAFRDANKPKPVPQLTKLQVEDLKRWSALKDERAFQWKPLFKAVERAGNEDIELLAFQPDKAGRRILLRGEGKDSLAVVEFIERLSSQNVLGAVHLTRQASLQKGRLNVVAFEIKASIETL